MTSLAPAAIARVELLTFTPASNRGQWMFDALTKTAKPLGINVTATTEYHGDSDLLMLWGPGHPSRFDPIRDQMSNGGHTVAFDLAYWHRDRKVRCAIDHAHPQQWVMRKDWPASRFQQDAPPRVANRWNPEGPVIIAGIGIKAKVQYGAAMIANWEDAIAFECQRRGRKVLYRRKRGIGEAPEGIRLAGDGPIETVLDGASLVATWHSNVAVDAIRLGIPVICQDGAARAVCARELPPSAEPLPTPLPLDVRDRFLYNLAWFQWGTTHDEARGLWGWLAELLGCE